MYDLYILCICFNKRLSVGSGSVRMCVYKT